MPKYLKDGLEIDITRPIEHQGTRYDPPHSASTLTAIGVVTISDVELAAQAEAALEPAANEVIGGEGGQNESSDGGEQTGKPIGGESAPEGDQTTGSGDQQVPTGDQQVPVGDQPQPNGQPAGDQNP